MTTMTDTDTSCCSQDLPVELRSLSPTILRTEGHTARIVSGLTGTEPDDEVISRELLSRQLIIPALSGTAFPAGRGQPRWTA